MIEKKKNSFKLIQSRIDKRILMCELIFQLMNEFYESCLNIIACFNRKIKEKGEYW